MTKRHDKKKEINEKRIFITNAKDMYSTIDEISEGHVPWKRVYFKYASSLPPNPL
jgi:hypothetical protein